LNLLKVKEDVVTLQTNLATETSAKEVALQQLAATNAALVKTTEDLKKTQTELADTKKERDLAVAEAAAQKKQAAGLRDEVNRIKLERDDAQSEVAAWKALGLSVDQIKSVLAQLKDVRKERDGLNETLAKWMTMYKGATNELGRYVNPEDQKVPLPPGLTGKVVVVDPKFDFIVLDVGESQGVLERGELLVSRDGKLVAKVRVWTVQRDRCVANVLPGWKLAEVLEGDQVVPAL
jgi:hypothetical protein